MRLPSLQSLTVEAASCDPVPPLLSGVVPPLRSSDEPPVLCAVAGRSDAGEECIAFLDQPTASRGERVRPAAAFSKPRGVSFSAAAQLMLPALTACAALQAVGIGSPAVAGTPSPRVVVAGSSGRLPALLVQMLCVAGCEPLVAGRAQDVAAIRALGPAVAALDHNAENFALVATARSGGGRLHAVFDTLGCEEEESLVQEYLDAAPQLVEKAASCPV